MMKLAAILEPPELQRQELGIRHDGTALGIESGPETLLREPIENSLSKEAEKEFTQIMAAAQTTLIQ